MVVLYFVHIGEQNDSKFNLQNPVSIFLYLLDTGIPILAGSHVLLVYYIKMSLTANLTGESNMG